DPTLLRPVRHAERTVHSQEYAAPPGPGNNATPAAAAFPAATGSIRRVVRGRRAVRPGRAAAARKVVPRGRKAQVGSDSAVVGLALKPGGCTPRDPARHAPGPPPIAGGRSAVRSYSSAVTGPPSVTTWPRPAWA